MTFKEYLQDYLSEGRRSEESILNYYIRTNKFLEKEKKIKDISGKKLEKIIEKIFPTFSLSSLKEERNKIFNIVRIYQADDTPELYAMIFTNENDNEDAFVPLGVGAYKEVPDWDIDNENDKYQRIILSKIKQYNSKVEKLFKLL